MKVNTRLFVDPDCSNILLNVYVFPVPGPEIISFFGESESKDSL